MKDNQSNIDKEHLLNLCKAGDNKEFIFTCFRYIQLLELTDDEIAPLLNKNKANSEIKGEDDHSYKYNIIKEIDKDNKPSKTDVYIRGVRRYYDDKHLLNGKAYVLCNDWYHPYNEKNASDTVTPLIDWLIKMESKKLLESISAPVTQENLTKSESEYIAKRRLVQGKFREDLIEKYKGCAVTGIDAKNYSNLLIASHIRPWKDSDEAERRDVDNGLLLCAHLDKLFDKGYITFSDEGTIIISEQLSQSEREIFGINSDMKINGTLNANFLHHMKYHRDTVFDKF